MLLLPLHELGTLELATNGAWIGTIGHYGAAIMRIALEKGMDRRVSSSNCMSVKSVPYISSIDD